LENASAFGPIAPATKAPLRHQSLVVGYHAHVQRRKRSQEDATTNLWADEFSFLIIWPTDIHATFFYDYRTNIDSYPKWQAWMRESSRSCW